MKDIEKILDKHRKEAVFSFGLFMALWIFVIIICIIGYDI
tara:strand:+ start:38 stop:157 length:120 start_codon:yes stop_codon:yes gene_type:complete